ncbi:MAG: S-formylglutathione hydrolase [Gammaproteobacteria bacterium]|nr:S-formylglutathione hydrolase [Gammaproteobacteria bacterium]
MSQIETVSTAMSHGGVQGVYRHRSQTCGCDMTFAVFVPPQAKNGPVPVLWYLSGLTCTHANVMEKGEYRRMAAERGMIVVCPDTSPRGDGVHDVADDWQIGMGAGFYVDATAEPWARHYKMESYVRDELPRLLFDNFPGDPQRQGIFGHSMGGHGALTLALKNPDRYRACSAFAPIVNPSDAEWSKKALFAYLGGDAGAIRRADACLLIEDGARFSEFLVDQGQADGFLEDGLMPERLEAACEKVGIPLILRMRPGYDHSYFFISSFMEDHLLWHAERLGV